MAPLSLRSTGNPDPSLLKSNSSPTLVNSASCVTLESFHFVFSLLCPCQVAITSHLGLCLMYDLAPVSCFFLPYFSCPLPINSSKQLYWTTLRPQVLCPVICLIQVSSQIVPSAHALLHNFPHCLANSTYSSGLSLGVTASGKLFMSPPTHKSQLRVLVTPNSAWTSPIIALLFIHFYSPLNYKLNGYRVYHCPRI